ncbi:MAG: cytochrome c, partial [Gammaproteobacteria bacterium]|nr:cytochrome c [Gammaproteobacteria bacterium]
MKKSTIVKIVLAKAVLIIAVVILVYSLFPERSYGADSVGADSMSNSTEKLYRDNCAECHQESRLGAMGPALLPENLKRLGKKTAIDVIKNGRVATQMPAFKEKLNDTQIQSLVDYVYTPLAEIPVWGMAEIRASQIIHNKES